MSSREQQHYPIIVVQDRYHGTYSRGLWLAVARADEPVIGDPRSRIVWVMQDGPGADDVTCRLFWGTPPEWIAVGETPDEAVSNLLNSPLATSDVWSPANIDPHPLLAKWKDVPRPSPTE